MLPRKRDKEGLQTYVEDYSTDARISTRLRGGNMYFNKGRMNC